jgi:hypothetical protein
MLLMSNTPIDSPWGRGYMCTTCFNMAAYSYELTHSDAQARVHRVHFLLWLLSMLVRRSALSISHLGSTSTMARLDLITHPTDTYSYGVLEKTTWAALHRPAFVGKATIGGQARKSLLKK